ncbi:MAG: hypothetical protein QM522_06150 [Chitinophagaceae bacterium]|nr:hypothetical protein [Chitinophagaceae bacterium]
MLHHSRTIGDAVWCTAVSLDRFWQSEVRKEVDWSGGVEGPESLAMG